MCGRNPEDPEKGVLPCIVFVNPKHPEFGEFKRSGFVIVIGWWDWSIKFGLIF